VHQVDHTVRRRGRSNAAASCAAVEPPLWNGRLLAQLASPPRRGSCAISCRPTEAAHARRLLYRCCYFAGARRPTCFMKAVVVAALMSFSAIAAYWRALDGGF
jgi:hypothetical protein